MTDDLDKNGFKELENHSSSIEEEGIDKYKPDPEKFIREQQALRESLKPKDYSELLHKDPAITEEVLEEKKQTDNSLSIHSEDYEKLKAPSVSIENQQKTDSLRSKLKDKQIELSENNSPYQETVSYDELLDDEDDFDNVDNDELKHKEKTEIKHPEPVKRQIPPEELTSDKIEYGKKFELKDEDTKMFCGLCHLCNVLVVTAAWVPFLIYLTKSDNDKIKFHAVQSSIYGLAAIIISILATTISTILINFLCLGCLLLPLATGLSLAFWGYAVFISMQTFGGKDYRIPVVGDVSYTLIKFLSE
ncbi:MAG: DUF4870 domain-containing protein [Cyanobacteriota bacterium]